MVNWTEGGQDRKMLERLRGLRSKFEEFINDFVTEENRTDVETDVDAVCEGLDNLINMKLENVIDKPSDDVFEEEDPPESAETMGGRVQSVP